MSDPRLGFFDDFLHLFGWDDVVVSPKSEGIVERICDIGSHIVGQVSFSQHFPNGHVLECGDDLTAGEAAAEFPLHVTVDDQRQITGEEMSFDVIFQTDISRPCLKLGLHDAEALLDLPSLMVHPDDVFGSILQKEERCYGCFFTILSPKDSQNRI